MNFICVIIFFIMFLTSFIYLLRFSKFEMVPKKAFQTLSCIFLLLSLGGCYISLSVPSFNSELLDNVSEKSIVSPDDNSEVTSTPEPSYYEAELQYYKSGSGDSVLQSVSVTSPSYFHFRTYDDGHHDVKAYYGSGDYDYDLLLNAIGSYNGAAYLVPDRVYDFAVNCDGKWDIEIYSLGYADETYFYGFKDTVTDIFQPNTGYYTITYEGTDNFVVKQWYGLGEHDYDLLVNEIGPYSGTVRISNSDMVCFFEVVGSEGMWSIKPSY